MEPLDLSRLYNPHPTLYTERLVLRPLRLSDAEAMFEYHSDPEVTRYVHFGPAESVQQTRNVIQQLLIERDQQNGFDFAIALRESDWLIGTLDLHTISLRHHRLEIGLMLTSKFWGKGYAYEAMCEAIRFAFDEMGMHRVEATIEQGNVRSERLAERVGMQREGVLRENEISKSRFISNTIYSILQTEFARGQ